MDKSGMAFADKLALIEVMRGTFGDEVADELAKRYAMPPNVFVFRNKLPSCRKELHRPTHRAAARLDPLA